MISASTALRDGSLTQGDSQAVYLKSEGAIIPALSKLSPGEPTLVIDSTTLDIDVARRVAREVEKEGAMMVDAPVSGGQWYFFFKKKFQLAFSSYLRD